MSRCLDCRYWITPENDYICTPYDPDTDEPIPTEMLDFEVRRCYSPDLIPFQRPEKVTGASVCDGSEYRANLYTAPGFGCVNFALRTAEAPNPHDAGAE